MRRLDELVESERSMLRQLSRGPASIQAISKLTGQADPAVWLVLARMVATGYVSGDLPVGEAAERPRIYRLTVVGQRTVDGD